MLAFTLAVFFLIITPGPGVLSTAGIGAAFGRRAGFSYVAGLFFGNLLVGLIIVTGLAAIILSGDILRFALGVLSSGYLLYLAFRIAFAGSKIAFIEAANRPGFWSGIFLQFVNPKAYAVNTALFSSFAFMPDNFLLELVWKFILLNLVWIPLHLLWLEAGVTMQKLSLSAPVTRGINIAMAISLTIVVTLSFLSLMGAGQ